MSDYEPTTPEERAALSRGIVDVIVQLRDSAARIDDPYSGDPALYERWARCLTSSADVACRLARHVDALEIDRDMLGASILALMESSGKKDFIITHVRTEVDKLPHEPGCSYRMTINPSQMSAAALESGAYGEQLAECDCARGRLLRMLARQVDDLESQNTALRVAIRNLKEMLDRRDSQSIRNEIMDEWRAEAQGTVTVMPQRHGIDEEAL